jgi:hypothetical protein
MDGESRDWGVREVGTWAEEEGRGVDGPKLPAAGRELGEEAGGVRGTRRGDEVAATTVGCEAAGAGMRMIIRVGGVEMGREQVGGTTR